MDPNSTDGIPTPVLSDETPSANGASDVDEASTSDDAHAPTSSQPDEQIDRLAQPVGDEQPPRLAFPVIGIGASAGGLEAYAEFLQGTRPDSGMAFVLIQHLSPKHESLLAELLAKHTSMPVLQVEDGIVVEPNVVYVIRPGFTMTLRDGKLHLGEPTSDRGHRRPVDDFFRSLAEEQRERAVAIILSGTGSNGTSGAQAIKAVGGLCIAEDPQLATFPSMPRSLIDAGLADFVLPPREMFDALSRYLRHPYANGTSTAVELTAQRDRHALTDVLAVLRTRGRHDFSGYKKQTLVRRVERRMSLAQTTGMVDYARALRENANEVTALADDMLIHVTGFFRDADVWETLRERVIVPLVAERADGASLRAWVTACSSGEEAYTLAILLVEAAEAAGKHFDIKIFATDAAERSVGHARRGVFPGGIESDVRPDRLARFFKKDDAFYHIKKDLRELVVFAPQNLLQDPPFSRLDICTCRNLLIYLEADVQRRVLGLLHFALRDGGSLVLGNSETASGAEDLFEPIDKKRGIFKRVGLTRHDTITFPIASTLSSLSRRARLPDAEATSAAPHAAARTSVAQLANRALLDWHTPAAVVVDRQGQIAYFHGRTERFLDQPRGEPTRELLALTRPTLRPAVREAFNTAVADGAAACVRDGTIGDDADRRRVEVTVKPLDHRKPRAFFLVIFDERPEPFVIAAGGADAQDSARLAVELTRVRHELQSAVEELQTSQEEMKASNEEVTSINEELQSTNEELETSKEELQSLNEELTTVNAQLLAKMEELEKTGNDLSSLLSSTDIAVIFLDTHFRIGRFTPAVKDLIDLIPADAGRPLSDLAPKFTDPDLQSDAEAVLEKLVPREREIRSDTDRWYLRRIMPYRTADNRIDGVVVTFVDITERRRAEASLRESVSLYRALTANLPNGAVFIVDPDLRYRLAEGQALALAGLASADFEGKSLRDALPAGLVDEYEARYRRTLAGEGFQLEHGAHGREFISHGVPLRDAEGNVYAALAVSYDITERKQAEEEERRAVERRAAEQRRTEETVRASEERLRLIADNVGDHAIYLLDPHGRVSAWWHGAERLSGYSAAEVVGQSFAMFSTPEDKARGVPDDELKNAAADGRAEREGFRVRKDGSRLWVNEVVTAIRDAGGELIGFAKISRDLSERKRMEDALRVSEERSRIGIEAASMGSWDWDVANDVVRWDATHNRLLGLPEGQASGTPAEFMERVHADDRAIVNEALKRALAGEGDYVAEFRVALPDGGTRWIAGYGRAYDGDAGPRQRMIGVILDVTDRKESELSRAEMLKRERDSRGAAEEANRVKDEFLATLSHELRTPLSAILIWAKLLRSREMTEANVGEGVEAIERSAQAQQQLINDLLDSSSIASGKLRLEMRETDLPRLLRRSIDAIVPTAEAKGVRVTADFAPDVGTALADADRLQQVIWNLLNNAVKFTPAGGRITVGLARGDGQVVIRCADTGRGISAEFLPHVFERFRQADSSRTRSVGGLGLGLAIVKQLVEMHGGTIVAESPGEGLGATFTVRLPLRSVRAPRLNPPLQRAGKTARTAKSNAGLRGKTVLLVEDQDDARLAVTSLLTGMGIAVEAVAGADDALRAFERRRPDAVLSDIGLPGKDGYALLRAIRATERASGAVPVPAIAITAFARDEDRRLAAEAGYDRFVAKPFEPSALVALLRGLLNRPPGEA